MKNHVVFDFTGAQVLVTGGTSGIGHAIAVGFAAAGATVTITGTRPGPDDYDTDLDGFDYRQLTMEDASSVDALVASLDALDVLVNNAGANFPGGRDEWDPDGFADSVALNLLGPMRLTRGVESLLRASQLEGGASVVSIASMGAYRSTLLVPGYGSAKAGMVTLTKNLANRWATKGVRANAVAPGLIDTPMTAPLAGMPEALAQEVGRAPFGRMGTPDEVVGAVLFLSSSAASFITGHTIAVDGGFLAV
jgi:3-oxoacyl-[acyl-carrier protein] reductase